MSQDNVCNLARNLPHSLIIPVSVAEEVHIFLSRKQEGYCFLNSKTFEQKKVKNKVWPAGRQKRAKYENRK